MDCRPGLAPPGALALTPEAWAQVKEIFADALERAPAERPALLSAACGDDAELLREVESLLASHEAAEAGAFIEDTAVGAALPGPVEERPWEGRRIGPYRVLDVLGRGGMGTVVRAVRDDEQYNKVVAIKVIRRGMESASVLKRFRTERQILAGLDHPNIASLMDGGATEDGLPYIVMEYVEGRPITEHAVARALAPADRLRLFRDVCGAVHYAHQKLVVHRDLKPSNILVTPEGVPKLLDFGIAKLLQPPGEEALSTLAPGHAMTPEYASPEQARGAPITTASDVYSLGIVLGELLTGERPSRPPSLGPQARAKPRLRGDLENIVLMALRPEPERRYASVDQLSEDVRRHLEGRPVIARPDTLRYRVGKFVGRNRAAVAAVGVLTLGLAGGTVAMAWEARIARLERGRAERHFNDVRRLANSLLFEFEGSIESLPGSAPARRLVVARGLEYLDGLARDAGRDPSLERELARAYVRLGDVQGGPHGSGLGDSAGALASYRKGLALRQALAAAAPADSQAKQDLAVAQSRIDTLLADEAPPATRE